MRQRGRKRCSILPEVWDQDCLKMVQVIKQVEEKLISQIAIILSVDRKKIKPEVPLQSLGVDSLSFVELLVFIEKEFKIKLMESGLQAEDFKTISSLASRISRQ